MLDSWKCYSINQPIELYLQWPLCLLFYRTGKRLSSASIHRKEKFHIINDLFVRADMAANLGLLEIQVDKENNMKDTENNTKDTKNNRSKKGLMSEYLTKT